MGDMENPRGRFWTRMKRSARKRLVSGLLVLVPLGLTFFVLHFLFGLTAQILRPVLLDSPALQKIFGTSPLWLVDLASVALLVVLLYFVGVMTNYVVGRRLIELGEKILLRIPLVKSIYAATKQVVEALSVPNRTGFKSVVLVEYPRQGLKAVAFVTGMLTIGEVDYVKVFIPTSPNPTTGFFQLVPDREVIRTRLSVEEGIKLIISAGIICPEDILPGKNAQAAESTGPDRQPEAWAGAADTAASSRPAQTKNPH